MEFIVHFISVIIKLLLQGSIYAYIILLLFILVGHYNPNSKFKKITKDKIRFMLWTWPIISLGLLVFMFTNWGNHGFGDGPQIPIGNGEIITNTNWVENCYLVDITNANGDGIAIEKYDISGNYLCAKYDNKDFYDYENLYFVFNTSDKTIIEFKNEFKFNNFAKANNLPTSNLFKDFRENYYDYWGGWRYWFLP